MKKLSLLLVFLSHVLYGQDISWKTPLGQINLQSLDQVSIDTRDQIFASTITGDIYLLNKSGEEINFFSPPRQAKLQQLEASWTVNIFSFSADLQEYRILDRFLNPLAEKTFLQNDIYLPKAATLGNNNIIWVYDESDFSIKGLNYLQNQLIQSQPLNLILATEQLNILDIKEYKNRVFIAVAGTGLFMLDNQANLLQKISIPDIQRISLFREMIFWIEDQKLLSYNMNTTEEYNWGEIPVKNTQFIHFGQEILVFQTPGKLQIFAIPQELKNLN